MTYHCLVNGKPDCPAWDQCHRMGCLAKPHVPKKESDPQMSNDRLTPEQKAEQLAQRFHEAYERLAPSFGYETRKSTHAALALPVSDAEGVE